MHRIEPPKRHSPRAGSAAPAEVMQILSRISAALAALEPGRSHEHRPSTPREPSDSKRPRPRLRHNWG